MSRAPGGAGPAAPPQELRELASALGVQLVYRDVFGRRRRASGPALVAVLAALGVDASHPRRAVGALRRHRRARWARACEPVLVAWDGRSFPFELRVPSRLADAPLTCHIVFEGGGERSETLELAAAPVVGASEEGLRPSVAKRVRLRGGLPLGYHRLEIESLDARALLIVAPRRAPTDRFDRAWGVFLPLHALRSARSQGIGDLSDLAALARWVGDLGGAVVGTLPVLASFADEGELFAPSPYAPASRLFWNELHVDLTTVPELDRSAEARELLASSSFRSTLARLNRRDLVDVPATMALKRRVLETLARSFLAEPSDRREVFAAFERSASELGRYAAFRAVCERRRTPWQGWPAGERAGELPCADASGEAARYHRYAQWIAHEQVHAAAGEGRIGLGLDLPLGAHPSGYDTWRWPQVFAAGATAGAPPDAFFGDGQEWGCPPLHPDGVRENGYAYPIACLRHLFDAASVVRIDHVMGLHRVFWVPEGLSPAEGVYVRYPAEELYAIVTLEAHRAGALVVGEDLGTVPSAVGAAMDRHGLHHTYVLQLEAGPDAMETPVLPPRNSVAMLNTHDMPPFAAFSGGSGEEIREGLRSRLAFLAASRARLVLVNLEDLWGETRAQNVPGTSASTNWRRRARYSIERFRRMPEVMGRLEDVDRLRRGRTGEVACTRVEEVRDRATSSGAGRRHGAGWRGGPARRAP